MKVHDIVRTLDIPEFRRVAGLQTLFEEIRAGGSIGENDPAILKKLIHGRCGGHDLSLATACGAASDSGGSGAAVPQHLEKVALRVRRH